MAHLNVVQSGYGKRDVESVIRKLLVHQVKAGKTGLDPDGLSALAVELVWEQGRGQVSSAPGETPHLMVLTALALVHGFQALPESDHRRFALTVALSNVLAEIEVNDSYALTSTDRKLIEAVTDTFAVMLADYNRHVSPAAAG